MLGRYLPLLSYKVSRHCSLLPPDMQTAVRANRIGRNIYRLSSSTNQNKRVRLMLPVLVCIIRGHSQPLSSSPMITCGMTTCRTPQVPNSTSMRRTREFLTHLDMTQSARVAITGLDWHFIATFSMALINITNLFCSHQLYSPKSPINA